MARSIVYKSSRIKVVVDVPVKVYNDITKEAVKIQTQRCIDYATTILKRARKRALFSNRTKNLADSYVSLIYYNGVLKKTIYNNNPKAATSIMYGIESGQPETGRDAAIEFRNNYKPRNKKGWEVVFATTAYYGGYLEKNGFNVLSGILSDVISAFGNVPNGVEVSIYKRKSKIDV